MKNLALSFMLCIAASVTNGQQHHSSNTSEPVVIRNAEIHSASNQLKGRSVADSALRVASVGGKYNVGLSIVSRSNINGQPARDAISHDAVTEVYHILEGNGILVVGGTLDSAYQLAPNSAVVRKITGPSSMGSRITGGTQYEVGPGDMIVIPANTPHGFLKIQSDRIVYSLVRIDTDKVLEVIK